MTPMEGQGLKKREQGQVKLGGRDGDEEATIEGKVPRQAFEALNVSKEIGN